LILEEWAVGPCPVARNHMGEATAHYSHKLPNLLSIHISHRTPAHLDPGCNTHHYNKLAGNQTSRCYSKSRLQDQGGAYERYSSSLAQLTWQLYFALTMALTGVSWRPGQQMPKLTPMLDRCEKRSCKHYCGLTRAV
jgi:hypothetical protein